MGYSPWVCKESDTTERLSMHICKRFIELGAREGKERDPKKIEAVRSQCTADPCERETEGKRIGPVESQITGQS